MLDDFVHDYEIALSYFPKYAWYDELLSICNKRLTHPTAEGNNFGCFEPWWSVTAQVVTTFHVVRPN